MSFPLHHIGTAELAEMLNGMVPKDNRRRPCPPESGSCEWWQGQRAHISEQLMTWLDCAHKTVEADTGTYDYARRIKCAQELLKYIDECDRNKPFCGTVERASCGY